MRWWLIGSVAMLAGCGDKAPVPAETPVVANETAAVDPAHLKCGERPDFVVLRPDAVLQDCASGKGPSPRRESGTIVYLTADKAADVTAWYREQAKAFEMRDALVADQPSPMYSAKDGSKRNFMVLTEAAGPKTRVTLNWGRDS